MMDGIHYSEQICKADNYDTKESLSPKIAMDE
jgi:hypothetical protein